MTNMVSSFAAASVLPVKVIKEARNFYMNGKLYPYHVQLSLTNKCNLNCQYCSCGDRDVNMLLDTEHCKSIMSDMANLGARSVTITGGGEPLLHPEVEQIMSHISNIGISMGLVTNGIILKDIDPEILRKVIWSRVSCSDDRDINQLFTSMDVALEKAPKVDWAFSYVATKDFDPDKLAEILRYANERQFTHVRVVSDLLDLHGSPDMNDIREYMLERGIDVKLAIFQGRKKYTRGMKRCLISLIKPFIGTDGNLYPCCGVQYAREDITKDFDPLMRMGDGAQDIWSIYHGQKYFDGSECSKCYYSMYNDFLVKIVDPVDHLEFI